MPSTFNLISTVVVGSGGTSSIDFNSIPQGYTDLQLVFSARDTTGGDFRLNINDFTGPFAWKYLYGNGSSASSGGFSGYSFVNIGSISGSSTTSNTFNNATIYFSNYSGSTYKNITTDSASENNATAAQQQINACVWQNTSPITQISIVAYGGSNPFVQNTVASLYGITKGSGGATIS